MLTFAEAGHETARRTRSRRDPRAAAAAAVAVIVFAVWARQNDPMGWQSGTNLVLGTVLLLVAAVRWAVELAPLVWFWMILLVGIAVAILAMWSMLYRPEPSRSAASS